MLGLGPDPRHPVALDDLGELRIFGKEAVAGMDRVGMDDLGGRDDVGNVEIAVGRRRGADAHGLVGEPDMHRVGVRGRVNRDRLDAHLVAGAVNAQRNLAAIGDQQLLDRHRLGEQDQRLVEFDRLSVLDSNCLITPPRGAVIGFITFIASTISRVSPALTVSPTLTNGSAPGSGRR
jgi:hypothetical protein